MRRFVLLASITALSCGIPSDEESSSSSDASDDADTSATDAGAEETETGSVGPTPGCGVPVEPGFYGLSLTVSGEPRSYWVSIPEGYDPLHPYPLVFAWHGLGGTAVGARGFMGVEEASQGAAIFLYPQGEQQPLGGSGWNLLNNSADMRLFDALVDELSAGACVDIDRVFSTGFSFGGYFSAALACYRGEAVRAIGSVGGGPSGAGCAGATAGWFAHNPVDGTVAFSQGTAARDQRIAENGCATTSLPTAPDPCVAYDGCMEGMPVHWCEHDEGAGGGHNWPSFAGAAIWDFFAAF